MKCECPHLSWLWTFSAQLGSPWKYQFVVDTSPIIGLFLPVAFFQAHRIECLKTSQGYIFGWIECLKNTSYPFPWWFDVKFIAQFTYIGDSHCSKILGKNLIKIIEVVPGLGFIIHIQTWLDKYGLHLFSSKSDHFVHTIIHFFYKLFGPIWHRFEFWVMLRQ